MGSYVLLVAKLINLWLLISMRAYRQDPLMVVSSDRLIRLCLSDFDADAYVLVMATRLLKEEKLQLVGGHENPQTGR